MNECDTDAEKAGGDHNPCTAFQKDRQIASGTLREVACKVKAAAERDELAPILIFDDVTSQPVEIDLRGTVAEVLRRLGDKPSESPSLSAEPPIRGPGRPKLGVVAREVTLLPRHWEWLSEQPGGASVALRKLVEEARRANAGADRARQARDAAYRFMSAMAGNYAGFEEATRALFAKDRARFRELTGSWPRDVRDHARKVAEPGFAA